MKHSLENLFNFDLSDSITEEGIDLVIEEVAPQEIIILPDGREFLIIGDPIGDANNCKRQGDNPYGFNGTCGLCTCKDILNQFGIKVTEADVVTHAISRYPPLCAISDDPSKSGGTTVMQRIEILKDFGVPAHAEYGCTLDDLAEAIETGHSVNVSVNAGILWDDSNAYDNGQINHSIVVTGVVRIPDTGEIQGYFINDSGTGKAGQFIKAEVMQEAWADRGGQCVITNITK